MKTILAMTAAGLLAYGIPAAVSPATETPDQGDTGMQLGVFSVSLAVKDLPASRSFYEKLGFSKVAGEPEQNWLILRNGTTTIGLFQGMFEKNILTFNPGWTLDQKTLEKFTDVRDLQRRLIQKGIEPHTKADESSTGPASFVLVDPDGNPILFDQHVPRPKASDRK